MVLGVSIDGLAQRNLGYQHSRNVFGTPCLLFVCFWRSRQLLLAFLGVSKIVWQKYGDGYLRVERFLMYLNV